jgi:hypothetical protein
MATQVHMSMGRAIQPFPTANDGDVLFAVTTAEIENPDLHPTDLGVVASETMWSAILRSVPDMTVPPDSGASLPLADLSGTYAFAPGVELMVDSRQGDLALTARGTRDIFDIQPGATVRAFDRTLNTFKIHHPFLERVRCVPTPGNSIELILNPGHWQQRGLRRRL